LYHNSQRSDCANFKKMKNTLKSIVVLLTILAFTNLLFSQKENENPRVNKVTITFKNNSLLPRKYTFVTYKSNENSNSTEGKLLMPYASHIITMPEGSKLYLANNQQIDTVMSGKKLYDKPFWVFKSGDNRKTIELK
jgi:hypothetical protein